MYELDQPTPNTQIPAPRLGGSHGYRIDGDQASLNAELSFVPGDGIAADRDWALQLWACDEPYIGGALRGFKVAEAPIALSAWAARDPAALDAVAFARSPAAPRDYSMVLVLAAGRPGALDQVHDFANYPARERFVVPHFEGAVAYQLHDGGQVAMRADRVVNPRGHDNLSGTLTLQLWALDEPYCGGEFDGSLLAALDLGQLAGQAALAPGEQRVALNEAPRAAAHVVLMLREWTAAGYLTRDYCTFAEPYVAPVEAQLAPPIEPQPEQRELAEQPEQAEHAVAPAAAQPAPSARPQAPAAPHVAADASRAKGNERASLNTASAEELARATGISKKLAETVIKGRPFKAFEELARVRGIGDKTIRKFRAAISL